MSSPGSVALTVELPARLVAERAALGLIAACAAAIEAVAGRYPDASPGLGLALGALLAAWHAHRVRRRSEVKAVALDGKGDWRLALADGRTVPAVLTMGSRVLGHSVVLRWRAEGRTFGAWLTGLDVPAARLHELRLRLLASGARSGA